MCQFFITNEYSIFELVITTKYTSRAKELLLLTQKKNHIFFPYGDVIIVRRMVSLHNRTTPIYSTVKKFPRKVKLSRKEEIYW